MAKLGRDDPGEDLPFLREAVRQAIIGEEEAGSYLRAFQVVRERGQTLNLPLWLVRRGLLTEEQRQQVTRALRPPEPHARPAIIPISDSAAPASASSASEAGAAEPIPARSLTAVLKAAPFSAKRKEATARGLQFGPYTIEREIARGGMGAVYLACHPDFGERLALKVLLNKSRANERQRKRFQREIETVRRLDHPGIVQIVDAGTIDNIDYLTMEFLDGRPLDDIFSDTEPLPSRRVVELVRDLALAVDHAHGEGVIHRDLKPANIIVRDSTGQPVVTDFGLAKDLLDSAVLSRTGTVIGTPRYLSPEQVMARHDLIGPTTDVYALGVILFEGLTGTRPFDADSVEALYQKIEDEPPPRPRELNPEIPEDLAGVCLKAMAKEQQDRYLSCADLAADLTSFLEHGRIDGVAPPRFQLPRALSGLLGSLGKRDSDRLAIALFAALIFVIALLVAILLMRGPPAGGR